MIGKPRDRKAKARAYIESRLAVHDYDELADILRGAEASLDWAPTRSTFYEWVRAWREARARDTSAPWSLATDETGRPDIVMSVLAALVGKSGGRVHQLTAREAHWIVQLTTALPGMQADGTVYRGWQDGHGADVIGPDYGSLRVWEWALRYVNAETDGDVAKLAELDSLAAVLYAAQGRHFSEAFRSDES